MRTWVAAPLLGLLALGCGSDEPASKGPVGPPELVSDDARVLIHLDPFSVEIFRAPERDGSRAKALTAKRERLISVARDTFECLDARPPETVSAKDAPKPRLRVSVRGQHAQMENPSHFLHVGSNGSALKEAVVAATDGPCGHPTLLHALEHDLTLKWSSVSQWQAAQSSAIALADVDADGDVEIIAGTNLFDHLGNLLWSQPNDQIYSASAVADLDGDGQQEILTGAAAYHADGTLYWENQLIKAAGTWAHPQVADIDLDSDPEVLVTTTSGIHLLTHDGQSIYANEKPTDDQYDWNRPLNIHDLDGDGEPEMGASSPGSYGVYEPLDVTSLWVVDVVDSSGQAGGTAFDFLGAGIAQTVYADEYNSYVYDDLGATLMSTARRSGTVLEYPVVADIDNDGSAEILVVSNTLLVGGPLEFTIQAVRDVDDRWVQARRIWNQHTYHVSNVREDGTIPQHEPPSWQGLNTYRTNAQIEGGGLCMPEPPG